MVFPHSTVIKIINRITFLFPMLLIGWSGYGQYDFSVPFVYGPNSLEGTLLINVQYKSKGDASPAASHLTSSDLTMAFEDQPRGSFIVLIKSVDKVRVQGLNGKNYFLNNYKFVFSANCNKSSGIASKFSFPKDFSLKDESSSGLKKRVLPFDVKGNGPVALQLGFDIIPKEENHSSYFCKSGEIHVEFNVSGIKPPVNEELEFWDQCRNRGLPGWNEYLRKYSNGQYANLAKVLIDEEDEKQWNKVLSNNKAKSALNGYISKFQSLVYGGKHLAEARAELNKINSQQIASSQAINAERQLWNKIKDSGTKEDYLEYLEKYPEGRYASEARRALSKLIGMVVEKSDNKDAEGYFVIKISNAIRPRYKDISPDHGLVIDHSRLRQDSILRVKYEGQGEFKLLIRDGLGQEYFVPFSNALNVALAPSSEDSSTYILTIDGGQQPYRVVLVNHLTGESAWQMDGIRERISFISKDSLMQLGLAGDFRVLVWDASNPKPVGLPELIRLPLPEKKLNWMQKLGIFFSIFILVGGIVFLFIYRSKRKIQAVHHIETDLNP